MGQYQASNIGVDITIVPEGEQRKNRKKSEEITTEKFPKFNTNCMSTDPKNSINPNENKQIKFCQGTL